MSIFNRRNAFIGWATWLVGKRVLKRKAKAVTRRNADPKHARH
jgi:hypothetical protein